MAETTKKILRLLHADHPLDMRCAAALVMGEVGTGEGESQRLYYAARRDESHFTIKSLVLDRRTKGRT